MSVIILFKIAKIFLPWNLTKRKKRQIGKEMKF